jgi:hypothetical protein
MEYNIIADNGIDYHIFEVDFDSEYDDNVVIWDMYGYRFAVSGIYDIDELLKIAISVRAID